MRTGWAVAALILTFALATWLMVTPELPDRLLEAKAQAHTSLSALLAFHGPAALAAIGLPLLLAFAARGRKALGADGLTLAVRAAIGLGLIGMLFFLAVAWWGISEPAPIQDRAVRWIGSLFRAPFWAALGGALFLESLRRRAARREGSVPAPAVSAGILLVLVAFSCFGMLLTMWRFE